jgi:glycolate oxidase iron-sulfur subunit
VNLDDENDSPRGRLVLMRRMLDGEIAIDDDAAGTHIDRCLGCRACETACPSGVPYGELLEATRATMLSARGLPAVARIILAVFARRRTLHITMLFARAFRATGLPRLAARVLPRRFAFPMAMLASTAPVKLAQYRSRGSSNQNGLRAAVLPDRAARQAEGGDVTSTRVASLEGCVMRGLFNHVNDATERTIVRAGCTLVRADGQGCCGALHAHAGDADTARRLARQNVEAFEKSGAEFIVSNSAGCGAMMKGYAHLLHDDPKYADRAAVVSARVRDASEFLAERVPVPAGALPLRVTHDAPCHQMHAQRVVRQPIALIESIPGVVLVPLEDADQCCGSAGIYNLIEPATSDAVLAPKLARIREAKADIVATGNPGCMMQIGAGLMLEPDNVLRVVHPVELLDAAFDATE